MQLGQGMPEVNAWGESHLWAKQRKEFSLSGLAEPRIPVDLSRGVSKKPVIPTSIWIKPAPTHMALCA